MNVIHPNFAAIAERPPAVSLDAIDQQLLEHEDLLAVIADFAHRDVVEAGDRIGNSRIEAAGSRLYSMLRLARRDIAATRSALDGLPDAPMRGCAGGQPTKAFGGKAAWLDAVGEYYACRQLEKTHPFDEARMSDVGYQQMSEDHSALMKRLALALKRAVEIPAPDCAGTAVKLDIIADYFDEHEVVVGHLGAVIADLRRLSGEAPDTPMRGHTAAEAAAGQAVGDVLAAVFDTSCEQAVADVLAGDPVARFWRVFDEFNAGGGSEEECAQAGAALDEWAPPTPRDFVRKFETMFAEGGAPTEERVRILVEQAVALLGGERSGREG